MLSEEELVGSIKEKMPDFPIQVSDLRTPTAKFVHSYYVRILEELGVDVEELQQPSSAQLQQLDYQDAYRHMLPLTNLYAAVSYIFEHIYVDDFSIIDLTEPNHRRTLMLIRAMDGFHTFADWKALNVQETISELFQRKGERDRLRAQFQEMKEEVNRRASERAQRDTRMKELTIINEEASNLCLLLKNEDSKLQEDVALSRAAFEEERHKLGKLQAEDKKLETEISKLNSQIVKSPVELERELNRLIKETRKYEEEKERLTQVKQEKTRQRDLFKKFLCMEEECKSKLKDIIALHERFKVVKNKQEEAQKKKQDLTANEKEIKDKTQKLQVKIRQVQEQKMALSMEWEKKKAALMQSIQETEREKEHFNKKSNEVNSKVAAVMAQTMQTEELFKGLQQLCEKKNKEYDDLYIEKTAQQDACLEKMTEVRKKLIEDLKKDLDDL